MHDCLIQESILRYNTVAVKILMLSADVSIMSIPLFFFFFSSRRRRTRWTGDWSSDVCSSGLMANIAGTPAVSLPVHVSSDGLPIGIQLAGPALADELLISVAAQLESLVRWQDQHPDLWTKIGRASCRERMTNCGAFASVTIIN